jgi:hypothetical protein
MPSSRELIERARMFEERADRARAPISRQHYREMAAHYRSLSVEHQETRANPERELEHGTRTNGGGAPDEPILLPRGRNLVTLEDVYSARRIN